MDDNYKYLFNRDGNASSVSNYSYGSANNSYRNSQYNIRKKTSIYPNYIPDNSYDTMRNEESSFANIHYPHSTNYHFSAESNSFTKKNYSSSVQTTSNKSYSNQDIIKSKPSIYQNPIRVDDNNNFFVGSSSTSSKIYSNNDAKKDKTNNDNPIQYVDEKYLANSSQKDLNQNAKSTKIYNQNLIRADNNNNFFVRSSLTSSKADSDKNTIKTKTNNDNPIRYVDEKYLSISSQKDLNQNAKKPKINDKNPIQIIDDDKFFVSSSSTSSKADSNKNAINPQINKENPIQYVDEKYLANSRLNPRQKDLNQNTKKLKINDKNPIQIIDDDKFFVSSSSTSSKADSNKNAINPQINKENPIQYVDEKYLANSRLNPRQKDLNQNAKKLKINNQNPIQIIDDDRLYSNLFSTSKNSNLNNENKESKTDLFNNTANHFNDDTSPREKLTSDDFESQTTMKTNRNIGELILVGKSTFHYLGRSGNSILALDSSGTIHYIPNNIYII